MSKYVTFEAGRPIFQILGGEDTVLPASEFELPMDLAVELAEKVRDFKERTAFYADSANLSKLEKELCEHLRIRLEWGACGLTDTIFTRARTSKDDPIDWGCGVWFCAQEVVDHASSQKLAFSVGTFTVPKGLRFTPFFLEEFLSWWMDVQEMGQELIGLKEPIAATGD